jgi:transglutaminase-like putative cysteine protease
MKNNEAIPHGNPKKRGLRLLWAAAASLIAMFGFLFIYFWYPTEIDYWIKESYIFKIPDSQESTIAMGVLLPTEFPMQQVSRADILWPGSHQIGTRLSNPGEPGVQTVYFQPVTGSGEIEASITYQVTIKVGSVSWQADSVDAYLQPSTGIECGASEIVSLVENLGTHEGEPDPYRLYQYVANALHWPEGNRINIEPSALQALNSGEGSCHEFSNLLVALNRASGNPPIPSPVWPFHPL